jgi:hypothetical protein
MPTTMKTERAKTLTFGFARSSQREEEEKLSSPMVGGILSLNNGMGESITSQHRR